MKIAALRTYIARHGQRCRGLLKIETDAGIDGWGEAYSIGPDLSVPPLADYIGRMIGGEDPRRIEYILCKLLQQFRFPPGGTGLAVISAVDQALWDIAGKAAGLPVYMLLGGAARQRVRVYHSIGGRDAAETSEQALRLHAEWGFSAFKLSPYRLDPESARWGRVCAAAAEYLEQVRRRTPAEFEFALDAHAKILEPVRAVQLAAALAPYDPLFLEEPLRPEHIPAWSRLRQQMAVPLATGESLYGRHEFLALMAAQAADIIQPDVCVCGGLLEMRRIAASAEAHQVTVAPHNPMSPIATAVNVHFAAATPSFTVLEYILPLHNEWRHWVDEPYLPRGGYLELRPDRPGWGVQVDEDALRDNEYCHWQRTCPVRPDGSTGYI